MLRYKTETRPGLVALYDIRPGNGAGPFLQPGARTGQTVAGISATNGSIQESRERDLLKQLSYLVGIVWVVDVPQCAWPLAGLRRSTQRPLTASGSSHRTQRRYCNTTCVHAGSCSTNDQHELGHVDHVAPNERLCACRSEIF